MQGVPEPPLNVRFDRVLTIGHISVSVDVVGLNVVTSKKVPRILFTGAIAFHRVKHVQLDREIVELWAVKIAFNSCIKGIGANHF
jgi:hypothetical protein